jgi:hypothetical protein
MMPVQAPLRSFEPIDVTVLQPPCSAPTFAATLRLQRGEESALLDLLSDGLTDELQELSRLISQ